MSDITLEHIALAVAQNPHPAHPNAQHLNDNLVSHLTKELTKTYPQLSLWGCVVLGFGLEVLDENKKAPSENRLNSLRTEDADCSHNSSGIRLGDRILCEFGIVDEKEWGQACKRHLVEFIKKDNLRCQYMKPPELDELAILGSADAPTRQWLTQVAASIQANILAAATPQASHPPGAPRL